MAFRKDSMGFWRTLLVLTLWPQLSRADDAAKPVFFGAHYGYISNVREERNKRDIEMVMLERAKDPPKDRSAPIVDEKLAKEFQQQYQYRFGQTQVEQVINSPGQFDEYTYYSNNNVTLTEYRKYQRQFAEYMGRRLTEHHVDKWAKNDPAIRPVYEFKDRISNLNMEVKKGYKVKWKYNFAGPNMDLKLENPYDVEAKIRAEMTGVISAPTEVIYTIGYDFTPRVHGTFMYKQEDGIYQLITSRRMTRTLTASLTASTDRRREGPTVQQDLLLLGLSWSD
jgi:hypothetical protein